MCIDSTSPLFSFLFSSLNSLPFIPNKVITIFGFSAKKNFQHFYALAILKQTENGFNFIKRFVFNCKKNVRQLANYLLKRLCKFCSIPADHAMEKTKNLWKGEKTFRARRIKKSPPHSLLPISPYVWANLINISFNNF